MDFKNDNPLVFGRRFLILTGVAFSLAACGGGDDTSSTASGTQADMAQSEDASVETETPTATGASDVAGAEVVEIGDLSIAPWEGTVTATASGFYSLTDDKTDSVVSLVANLQETSGVAERLTMQVRSGGSSDVMALVRVKNHGSGGERYDLFFSPSTGDVESFGFDYGADTLTRVGDNYLISMPIPEHQAGERIKISLVPAADYASSDLEMGNLSSQALGRMEVGAVELAKNTSY